MFKSPDIIQDGSISLDNSNIEQLQYCPRSWLLKYGLKRISAAPSAGRNFGSGLHEGWAIRYRTCGENEVFQTTEATIVTEMLKFFQANPQPESDFRNPDHAVTVMKAYNRHYKMEPFKILTANGSPICESSFKLLIGEINGVKVYYTGKIDLGIQDTTGLWVMDHKTAFQFGRHFEMEMARDTGQLGYCWSFWKLFGTLPTGYITNAVRIRRPKKEDEYCGVAPCDHTDFKRLVTCVTEEQLVEFTETVLTWASLLLWHSERNNFPRVSGKRGCIGKYGPCDYYDLCNAPIAAREGILSSSNFIDNKWSPLNKRE